MDNIRSMQGVVGQVCISCVYDAGVQSRMLSRYKRATFSPNLTLRRSVRADEINKSHAEVVLSSSLPEEKKTHSYDAPARTHTSRTAASAALS